MAAQSFSYDSLTFFITSSSAREQASMEPFTVMVLSGLYRVRSCRLDGHDKDHGVNSQCSYGGSNSLFDIEEKINW